MKERLVEGETGQRRAWWKRGRVLYLDTKLVEEVVHKVLGTVHDAVVEVLPCDVMEDGPGGGWSQLVLEAVQHLVSVHRDLKHQQGQHHQVVLRIRIREDRIDA